MIGGTIIPIGRKYMGDLVKRWTICVNLFGKRVKTFTPPFYFVKKFMKITVPDGNKKQYEKRNRGGT